MSRDHENQYAPLFETENGRVLRCLCCGVLHVRFGNVLLALAFEDFEWLQQTTADLDCHPYLSDVWRFGPGTIRVGDSGVSLILTRDEMVELHQLLAGARLLLDVGSDSQRASWHPPPTDQTDQ